MQNVSIPSSNGKQPSTPTIGSAVNTGTGTSIKVSFTGSSYVGKPASTLTYTAKAYKVSDGTYVTSTSGSTSPVTVTGLTNGTAYKFTVLANNGTLASSLESDFSNSMTPVVATTTTAAPTSAPTTAAPTSAPTTAAPTSAPTTAVPTTTTTYDCLAPYTSAECTACGGTWQSSTSTCII